MWLSAPIFRLKRQAKLLARDQNIPLHEALDRVAVADGFRSWSHLASTSSKPRPAESILEQLDPGDMLLLGARPGQGKTLLGLELAALAPRLGRTGLFFTLDYNERDVLDHFEDFGSGFGNSAGSVIIDTSDDICASHITNRIGQVTGDVIAVVDYLQLLDQKRKHPELGQQIGALKSYSKTHGSIVVMISQIDRRFELADKRVPGLSDVRLPNPVDLSLFDKTCFLHEGDIHIEAAA